MTQFLRFIDAATWTTATITSGFLTDEGLVAYTHNYAIDVIGPIVYGGEFNLKTGDVITEPTILDGWHVNFIGELPLEWNQFVVEPTQPYRVFA